MKESKNCKLNGCGKISNRDSNFCDRHLRQIVEGKFQSDVDKKCKGCDNILPVQYRPDRLFCSKTCKMKYHRREGSYRKERLIDLKRLCSIDDCNEPIRARGLCNKHNIKFIRYGDPKISRKKKRNFCSIDGCDLNCVSHGFCSKHYTSFLRYGDPLFISKKRAILNLKHEYKREYRAWQSMKTRCHNVKSLQYKYYGKKGIKVHGEWRKRNGFLPFLNYLIENTGVHLGKGYHLDRIDSTKNYEPGNIQWLVESENCRKRTNVKLNKKEIDDIRKSYPIETMNTLSKKYNVTQSHILRILNNEVSYDKNYMPNKNRRRVKVNDEMRNNIKILRNKGYTIREISNKLKISSSAINATLLGRKGKAVTHPLYQLYLGMVARCTNKNNTSYQNYGGRGIKICDMWRGKNGFDSFIKDVGPRPSKKHSLDRTNPNGDYEPNNVRWATSSEQNLNKRSRSLKDIIFK